MRSHQFPDKLPKIAVVSVSQNKCGPLLTLLSQIGQLNYPSELLDIFLVDSGSTDGTTDCVRKQFPSVNLATTSKNLGIAAGFNMAIKAALGANRQYKYLWLLDSDARIDSETLMPLVETAEEYPDIAVVGSAVYEPDKSDQLITAGLFIDWKNCNVAFNIPKAGNTEDIFDVELIPACSSLTRAELYEKQGLWDERLWLYWGDTEWCARSLMNGYRVCCNGKSKVWHRNWANIKPNFYFPFALHDRVRSALVFNLLYNPDKSISGIRRFILKSYLKAAFENFTARPNFSRAYDEGVQDFLSGNTSKKAFSSWLNVANLPQIDEIAMSLTEKFSKKPKIILNQLSDESLKDRIKEVLGDRFDGVIWEEIAPGKGFENASASARLSVYLFSHMPRLLLRLLLFFRRRDLIVSPVAVSHLYNIASARFTVLVDGNQRCYICRNRVFTSFVSFVKLIMKGIKAAFFDLPKALRSCEALKKGPIGWIGR